MKKQKRKMKVCQQGREDGNLGISFTQHLMMISKAEKSFIIRHLLLSLSSGKSVNVGAGEIYETGPPGRAPNLGHSSSVRPDGYWDSPDRAGTKTEQHPILKADITAPLEVKTTKGKICKTTDQPIENNKHRIQPIKNKMQIFTNIKFKKIMKKQILILALFALAILSSTINSFGQALDPSTFSTKPNPLVNCLGSPQQPKAGISYKYLLDPSTSVKAPTDYKFWATKDKDFIKLVGTATTDNSATALKKVAAELLDHSANYNVGGTTPSVDITWTPEVLSGTKYQGATPTFVVGLASDGCTDNIKVWEIDPSPSFTVDIKNITQAGTPVAAYGDPTTQCVDKTRAAKYSATFGIDYDYGKDVLYYEVIASNFVTSWKPTFFLTGLDGTIQTAEIHLAKNYTDAVAGTYIEGGDITTGTFAGTKALTSSVANTTDGVSLIVKVIISNKNYETLAQETIKLSVAGEDADGFDINDDATCTVPATDILAAADDVATRTIDPRPAIDKPAPTTIILTNTGVAVP